jgi:DNA-binding NtrC family response regulator
MQRVLVVDDEPGVRESLRMLLRDEYEVECTDGVDAAIRAIAAATPDLVLLDLVMPGRSGLELLETFRDHGGGPPVIVVSATRAIDAAIEAMKLGAADFITKPFDAATLHHQIRQLLERSGLEQEVARLRAEVADRRELGGLLGVSLAMREVFRWIERAAAARAAVLITGESGTGKELAARAIHDCGPRREAAFVAVNCAAIPETLLESELFGHEKGAFTDARQRRIGRFEAASGGTLFLDEIAELAPPLQAKLLRALQEQTIDRLGGNQPIPVDVRVVAATNRDLRKEVAGGGFRTDLYYRINVLPIALPPLRDRREDLPILAARFLERGRARMGRGPAGFALEARRALQNYPWPGNVRELENVIERTVALCDREEVSLEDLPEEIRDATRMHTLGEAVRSGSLDLESAVAEFESELIHEALTQARGNQTRAAERLGITRRVLKLKIDRYGLPLFDSEQSEKDQ